MQMKNTFVYLILLLGLIACQNQPVPQGKWIVGTPQKQIDAIEKQFRGFDMVMVETGYRYQELYWAGQDQNWEYAEYQLEKLKKAIKNGLQRRPKRAQSAQHFITKVLPQMKEAVSRKDTLIFNNEFQLLTTNCNVCHAMEKVPFFTVKTPLKRQSPIRK